MILVVDNYDSFTFNLVQALQSLGAEVEVHRNDVGRVSRPGTVKVEEREVIERYSHVMHMVSQVSGTLDPGLDAWDVVAAAF
ncbi:MAG TPA: chorismate-binding protein, partial [Myxococcaceae bacterium]|nr:chorismate-binding protein [Myxococcaceae bacterium]